jgi:NADP-dependent 3-hydroxy acid dehydrogenase YdfG
MSNNNKMTIGQMMAEIADRLTVIEDFTKEIEQLTDEQQIKKIIPVLAYQHMKVAKLANAAGHQMLQKLNATVQNQPMGMMVATK